MDILNSLISWIPSMNWTEWMGVAAAFVLFFDRLAKLTPTTKDDSIVNWIYKIFAVLGAKVPELEYNRSGQIVAAK